MILQGSIAALVTPMTKNSTIDWVGLENIIKFHLDNGTNGIVVNGTTGEAPTLSMQERSEIIEFVLKRISGRIPVIAGTGSNCTTTTISLTQTAFNLGVDACLIVVPYYNKPNQDGLVAHFTKIAENCAGNLLLYNVPSRTVSDLLPATVAKLAKLPNIIGIKEATGDLEKLLQLKELCPIDFKFFSGNDQNCLEFMQLGGHGVISVTANIVPNLVSEMCLALGNNELDRARQINKILSGLNEVLFLETNPVPIKWAMHLAGLIEPYVRLPLVQLPQAVKELVQNALCKCGIRVEERYEI